jgi:hypothetical protein
MTRKDNIESWILTVLFTVGLLTIVVLTVFISVILDKPTILNDLEFLQYLF